MKKIIEILKNPAMTVFIWLLAGACYLSLWTNAIKHGDKPQVCVMVLFTLAGIALFLRYKDTKK